MKRGVFRVAAAPLTVAAPGTIVSAGRTEQIDKAGVDDVPLDLNVRPPVMFLGNRTTESGELPCEQSLPG
jgi:hypothetical protein